MTKHEKIEKSIMKGPEKIHYEVITAQERNEIIALIKKKIADKNDEMYADMSRFNKKWFNKPFGKKDIVSKQHFHDRDISEHLIEGINDNFLYRLLKGEVRKKNAQYFKLLDYLSE